MKALSVKKIPQQNSKRKKLPSKMGKRVNRLSKMGMCKGAHEKMFRIM